MTSDLLSHIIKGYTYMITTTNGVFTDDYEVLTDEGFKDFKGIKQTIVKGYYILNIEQFNSIQTTIICSTDHIFNTLGYGLMSISDIKPNTYLTEHSLLINKEFIDKEIVLYDLLDVDSTNHTYHINNGISSKNCAFISNWVEFSASVLPVISSGKTSKLILLSTPNGLNHFYEYYMGAKNQTNGFKLFTVKWDEVPNRDEEWLHETMLTLNYNNAMFAQEYCVEFNGSSGGLINSVVLKNIKDEILNNIRCGVLTPYNKEDIIHIIEKPNTNSIYIATVDTSRGKGIDYSVCSIFKVIDNNTYEQVAMARTDSVNVQDFSQIVLLLCNMYNNPYLLVEINDLGEMLSSTLYEAEYENLICTIKEKGNVKVTFGSNPKRDKGIRTTILTKNKGCQILRMLVEQRKLKINNLETVDELSNFVKSETDKTYSASKGFHDDICMTLVLLAWLVSDVTFMAYLSEELNKETNGSDVYRSLREYTDEEINNKFFGFVYQNSNDDIINQQPQWEDVGVSVMR